MKSIKDNLYKAAKSVIRVIDALDGIINTESHEFKKLQEAIIAYEQEQASSRNQKNDFILECIKHQGGYTVSLLGAKGLIVEVDNLKDAPKEIAKSIEVILMYHFDEGKHLQYEICDSKEVKVINEKPDWNRNMKCKTKEQILGPLTWHEKRFGTNVLYEKALLAMQLYSDQQTSHLKAENERLQKEIGELRQVIKQRDFMIEHGLGPEDMINDITMPHEI